MKKDISDSLYGVYQAPLDAKLAPVNTVADLNLIPRAHRYIGMTIMVLNTDIDEEPCEYWLANGTTDEDWVKKSVNLTGYATEEFVNEAVSELADEVTEALNTETERTNSAITSAVTELEKAITTAIQNETARTEDTYLKEHQSLEDYSTTEETAEAIANAVNTAIQNETARTEDTYLKEHQSLEDYYTSEQTEQAITSAITDAIAAETARTEDTYLKEHQSLEDYYTSEQTEQAITTAVSNAIATETARTDNAIASAATEIKEIIEENEEITASALNQLNDKFSDYYTSAETESAITSAINEKVVNIYRYKGSVSSYAELPSQNLEVGDVYNVEAAYGDIPAGTNFAWKGNAWDPLGGSVDLSAYWTSAGTQSAITSAITDAIAAETARTEQRYLTEHQSLAAYYTSAQTNSAITSAITDITEIIEENERVTAFAITELNEQVTGITDSLGNYYTSAETESAITSAITDAIAAETARTEQRYLTEHQSLANYYTSGQIDSAITNAANEIKDIIEENEEVTASAFNQLNEKFTNYYTSAETDNAITTAINDKVVNIYRYKGSVSTYAELPSQNLEVGDVYNVEAAYGDIPAGTNFAWKGNAWDPLGGSVDLSAYYTSAQTNSAITSAITDAIAAETARTEQRYLTEHQSLAAYYTSAQTNSAITSAITDITEIIEDNERVTAFAITELNEQVTGISQNLLPQVSSTDNGKILQVVNGAWTLVTPTTLYSGSSTPDNQQGNNGDIYVQTGE